ncbi:hypothetical protein SmJEL517_g03206 [Synchytrium microbalum]|uniref:Uncharacterized protein n=1 Tax=Synchytrium microbalum TaxID=1806994 RepID=A0A507C900_9FUNG|nr:uncharacterized protein SmJEL517_g03206 [Synchytrium microbalum]TPX33985.1 hypothetical protein SmJEL517_g03206 [Synchytrium microbalum]
MRLAARQVLRTLHHCRLTQLFLLLALPDLPLFTNAYKHAERREHPAIISKDRPFGYAQLLADVAKLRDIISTKDLKEARVAFLFPHGYEWTVAHWAIWASGATAVPLAPMHPPPESEYYITDSESEVVVVHTSLKDKLAPMKLGPNVRIIEVGDLKSQDYKTFEREEVEFWPIDFKRMSMINYTSGTTGKPKGVIHTHNSIAAWTQTLVDAWKWSNKDKALHVLPLHHLHGQINAYYCGLLQGASIEFTKFDAQKVWDRWMDPRRDLTLFMGVPTMFTRMEALYKTWTPEKQQAATESCKQFRLLVSGSAALPDVLYHEWERISGHQILERYGMTEIGAAGNPVEGARVPGTVGVMLKGVEIKLIDEATGENVTDKTNTPGMAFLRGPMMFSGYWKRPDATAEVMFDGWYRSGDVLIRSDQHGYFKVLGRASVDIIKSGGYKISALEIEREILDHPSVLHCAVMGVADKEWGERVGCVVVFRDNADCTLEALREFLRPKLAPYKLPSLLKVLKGDLPRNSIGKINKKTLVEIFNT